jgi:hypothetical protein
MGRKFHLCESRRSRTSCLPRSQFMNDASRVRAANRRLQLMHSQIGLARGFSYLLKTEEPEDLSVTEQRPELATSKQELVFATS